MKNDDPLIQQQPNQRTSGPRLEHNVTGTEMNTDTGEESEALCAAALKPQSKDTDARKQTSRDAARLNVFSKNRHGRTKRVDGLSGRVSG